ncbi:hypothetical protein [Paenibacillus chitinolyticus]|uniref:hypothetical protein n=1 Tax=Paenibacillus chitinolyticus TaxID=79263 RepID=UPI00366B94AD
MSRNLKLFKNALTAKGYTLVNAFWQPIGGNVEMIGREGGWVVEYTCDGDLSDLILEYSADEVLKDIERLEKYAG